jgi:cell division protein FtsL
MENLSKVQKITIITIAIIMLVVIVYYFMHKTKEYDSLDINEMVQSENNEVEEAKEEQVLIVVHITGEVKKEGVVSILEGARITDVIDKARRSNRKSRFIKSKFSIYSRRCRQNIYSECSR